MTWATSQRNSLLPATLPTISDPPDSELIMDLFALVLTALLFGTAVLYTRGCDRLRGGRS